MGIAYSLAYRAGIIPWEKAGRDDRPVLDDLLDQEELDHPDSQRRALDLGCGRGVHTRLLVERGWHAMGIDDVREAVDVAVRRSGLDDAHFVIGDVRHLVHSGIGKDFDLFLDAGCFHGLDDPGRTLMAGGVTELAAPGATVLVRIAEPRRLPFGVRGATQKDLERAFRGWTVAPVGPGPEPTDDHRGLRRSRRSRRSRARWYRLTRPPARPPARP